MDRAKIGSSGGRNKSPKLSHRERNKSGSGGRHSKVSASTIDERHRSKHDGIIEELMTDLIDEIALGLCFEVHRSCRMGTYNLDNDENMKQYEIIVAKGRDVFGMIPAKRQVPECSCPNCFRTLSASRFAPHLEKCMGMGRNSSRLASRRIANVGRIKAVESDDSELDNENDHDWSYVADKKAKRMKKDKSGSSKKYKSRSKHLGGDDIPSVGSNVSDASSNSSVAYENMSLEERKAILSQSCGVISEHTRKMCTKSLKCPQHTDIQRASVRTKLLGAVYSDNGDMPIDIDSYDDNDQKSMRDVLQWHAAAPSPSDSTSTLNSVSSINHKKSRHKSSKKHHSSKKSRNRKSAPPSSSLRDASSTGTAVPSAGGGSAGKWPAGSGAQAIAPRHADSSDSNQSSQL